MGFSTRDRPIGDAQDEDSISEDAARLVDAPPDVAPPDMAPPDMAPVDAPPTVCPGSYSLVSGQTNPYRLAMTPTDWVSAEAACAADGPGIHLIVMNDSGEHLALTTFTSQSIWMGTSDRITEGTFLSVTGGVTPFLPWAGGEPSVDDCVYLNLSAYTGMCTMSRKYVCECDGLPPDPSTF